MRTFLSLALLIIVGIDAGHAAGVVTAGSHLNATHLPALAADGDNSTRWASKHIRANTPEWLQIDFGKAVTVTNMAIRWEAACAAEYIVKMSTTMTDWTTVCHVTDGKAERRVLNDVRGSGRYLRIACLKRGQYNLFSIWEVEFTGEAQAALHKQIAAEKTRIEAEREASRKQQLAPLSRRGVEEIIFATREDGRDGHWYANFSYLSPEPHNRLYGKQGRLCRYNIRTDTLSVLIEDLDGTVRDPVVHYDADKILFSWRKGGTEHFHLYECDIDGENIRQITQGGYDDIEPCYLPDGGIVFVSSRCKRWVNCWASQVAVLYRCNADGSGLRQLSANIEHDNTPWVLPDGRIIYQRWEYVDRSQVNYHHLWTVNPDGTGHMIYYGNMHSGGLYIDAKPMPGADGVLFINSPGHGRKEHTGFVATVSDRNGPDDKAMLRNITTTSNYRDPWPLSPDTFIAARDRSLVLLDDHGNASVFWRTPDAFGAARPQEPRPLIKRPREKLIPSRVDLSARTGKLVLSNVYFGRNMQGVKPGEIKKLLVLESLPKPINFTGGMDPLTYGGSFTLERVVGTIPVEPDGSAYMELPADRAFFFVALDENDNSVKRMQSFLSVAPGEVASCVGCHEPRGQAPLNTHGSRQLQALRKPPHQPEPIEGIPEVFDFPRDIQPLLDRHCVKCHNNMERGGGVTLTGDRGPMFSHSYVMLTVKRQVADGRNKAMSNYPPRALGTSASPLMKKIDGSHYAAKLSPQEQDMIRYWIESAACYPGTYASLGHGSIGGYQQNRPINRDVKWETHGPFRHALQKRCTKCHKHIPRSLMDESGMSFWQINPEDPKHRRARHIVFNLTHPDKSLFLLAPLARDAGGLGTCKTQASRGQGGPSSSQTASQPIFADTLDPDYLALLAHIEAGKTFLENDLTRFDMPNFRPRKEYLDEMKRYGILPASFDTASPTNHVDVYELDRKYWHSLWWQPSD